MFTNFSSAECIALFVYDGGSTVRHYFKHKFVLRDTYSTHKLRKLCFLLANHSKTRYRKIIVHFIVKHIPGMKMKIPNTGSGNGYYGHETGIISYLESNLDPEVDMQGPGDTDFSEYLWMENEEEFDKEVLQQLEEEELTEECLKAMLEEEKQHERNMNSVPWSTATSIPDNNGTELCQQLNNMRMHDDLAKQSTLNPNAAEFVPAFKSAVTSVSTPPEVTAESS